MPKLLKNGIQIQDIWRTLSADKSNDVTSTPAGPTLFPLRDWLEHHEFLLKRPDSGLWLNSDDEPGDLISRLGNDIAKLPCIAIYFPAFTDGRGFSLAKILRGRYHYRGELRAAGSILVDQLYYLKRCGFDAYEIDNNEISDDKIGDSSAMNTALHCLKSFSIQYQADS